MKSILSVSAITTATAWLYTFIVVLSSLLASCDKPGDTVHPATGWNGTTLADITDNDPTGFVLTGNLSEPPRDLSVDVYYFPAGTPVVDALTSITDPGTDEDGEPEDAPDPDDSFEVKVKLTDNGKPASNYNAAGQFGLYLLEKQLAVVAVSDGKRTTYAAVSTDGTGNTVPFDLSKARSAKKAAAATATVDFVFGCRDAGDGDPFNARLFGDIWYFPAITPDQDIYNFFGDPNRSDDWNPKPTKPDDTRYVLNQVSSGHYNGSPGTFSKSLKAGFKIAIVWNFLDASPQARANYRHPLCIYYAPVGSTLKSTIWTDQFRAGL